MKKFLIISLIVAICLSFTTLTISAAPDIDSETVTASGDVNGDLYLDIKDVTLMQKYLAKMVEEREIVMENFDFNGDGIADIADGTALQKYITQNAPIYLGSTQTTTTTSATRATDTITFPVVEL